MSLDQSGRLKTAEWHLREAFLCASVGEQDKEDYHNQAAREFIALVAPESAHGAKSTDELMAICLQLQDRVEEPA